MLDCLRKKNNFDFKELLSADAIIFLKIIYFFLCPQKVEKTTLKSCSEILKFLSALLPLAAQTEEFMFQNVAYRPTVYKTGANSSTKSDVTQTSAASSKSWSFGANRTT